MIARFHYGFGLLAALVLAVVALSAGAQQATNNAASPKDLYEKSAHADVSAYGFSRWDKDGSVAPECAGCHSTLGFLDMIGADGSAVGTVDHPVPAGSAIECAACHDEKVAAIDSVTFPSGRMIEHPGTSASCLSCHSGRTSYENVDAATDRPGKDDAVADDLRFVNIHFAAAAVWAGAQGAGGYEYPGRSYAGVFDHAPGAQTCTDCHDAHSSRVQEASCASCHGDRPVQAIRAGSADLDGDGDQAEGLAAEIHGLHAALGQAMSSYAAHVGAKPILYTWTYPYFVVDLNGDGQLDGDDLALTNAYTGYTPRLLRAAYNYQVIAVDPGAWAHNPIYAAQLLHDSIADLGRAGAQVPAIGARP